MVNSWPQTGRRHEPPNVCPDLRRRRLCHGLRALEEEHPELIQGDFPLSCAVGNDAVVRAAIARDPNIVHRTFDAWTWLRGLTAVGFAATAIGFARWPMTPEATASPGRFRGNARRLEVF